MSHIVGKDQGLYDPTKRYAFTNITAEDFVSAWGGAPITIKAGQSVELTQHLANKLTDELVDKIMIGNVKLDEVEYYKKNPNTEPNRYRAASSLGVPAARKVWEDKIVRELAIDEESPQVQIMRAELRAELEAELKKEPTAAPVHVPTSLSEFSELGAGGATAKPTAKPKPLKVKTIETPNTVS